MSYRQMRFPEGKSKALTFSYDDGVAQDRKLAKLLKDAGMKGTFNLVSKWLANPGATRICAEDAKQFIADGHEIAVHTSHHTAPGLCTVAEGINNVLECRKALEQQTGTIIRGMAYPDSGITNFQNGASYSDVKHYLTDLGIAYSRSLGGDNCVFLLPRDWHAWTPTCHHNNEHLFEWLDMFKNVNANCDYLAARYPRLFYLWGHSYEFDNNNNWDRIERFCQEASGNEDIWYATNIEIYDYVEAYRSLIISADGHIYYNPTVTTVWFEINAKPYSLGPGETICI